MQPSCSIDSFAENVLSARRSRQPRRPTYAQLLVFCAAGIWMAHKYGGLLRALVASASNDHRLGANEAPPAIISILLGEQLADFFDQIAKGAATRS